MKRILTLGFVFCFVCMAVIWMAWTSEKTVPLGFRSAVRWLPGDLKVASIRGSFSKTILFEDLSYYDGKTRIGIKSGVLDIGYFDWIAAQWTLNQLHLEGLSVTLPDSAEKEQQPFSDFAFPVSILVRDFLLEVFSYTNTNGKEIFRLDRLQFSALAQEKTIHVLSFDGKYPGVSVHAVGKLSTVGNYPFELDLEWIAKGGDAAPIRGGGVVSGTLEHIFVTQKLEPPLKMNVRAEVFSPMSDLSWQAKLSLDQLDIQHLNLTSDSLFVYGDILGQGDTKSADLKGKYRFKSKVFGKYQGTVDMSWKDDSILFRTLGVQSETSRNKVQLKGMLAKMNAGGEYSFQGDWKNLEWPLNGAAEWYSRKGQFKADGTFTGVEFSINGDVLEKPVAIKGSVNKKGDSIDIPAVVLKSESTAMQLSGSVGKKIDLKWDVTSDELAEWIPSAKGKGQSQGSITGRKDRPVISTVSQGQKIVYQDWQVEKLSLQGEVATVSNGRMDVDFIARGVVVNGEKLNVTAKSRGTVAAHRINANITANRRNFVFAAQGGVQKDTWTGILQDASYSDAKIGDWRLRRQPGGIVMGKNQVSVEKLCWTQKTAALCGDGSWQAGIGWDSMLSLVEMPLSIISSVTDEKFTVTGLLDGAARLRGTHEKITWGDIEFALTSGVVKLAGEDPVPVAFGPVVLKASISKTHSDLTISLSDKTQKYTPVRGNISIPDTLQFAALKQLPVQGKIDLELLDFSLLSLLAPEIIEPIGQMRGAVTIGGRIGNPIIEGGATVSSASFGLPDLGITLSEVELNLKFQDDNTLIVNAESISGGGPLSLNGQVSYDKLKSWQADFHLSGDEFVPIDLPEAYLKVSPELDLTVNRSTVDLTGRVFIPEARLESDDKTQVIQSSKDVVIVPEQPTTQDNSHWKINSRINLTLGDAINVSGFGFIGRIAGALDIEDRPEGITLATGELRIKQGEYSIYGQTLAIEEGRLNYSKSPVNNPAIAIRAIRKSDSMPKGTKVGVDLTGTLDKPKAVLFSNQPMTESDMFAYLVTGSPLNEADSEQGDLLNEAATSLGLAGGNQLLGLFSDNVGFFDELKLKSTSEIDQTVLFLGKYLTPELYVEYGVGLLDTGNLIRLNYRIHKNWELESESGKETSADILFTVDF